MATFKDMMIDLIAPNGELSRYFKLKKIKGWPQDAESYDSEETGVLDLENCEFINLDKDKFVIETGGDWQKSYIVVIVKSGSNLKVKEYHKYKTGRYNQLNKKPQKSKDILDFLFSEHPSKKDFKQLSAEIKKSLGNYKPYDNSYGDERYENKIVERPKFDKDNGEMFVVWNLGGHSNVVSKNKDNWRGENHLESLSNKFNQGLKNKFWFSKDYRNSKFKTITKVETIEGDNVRYSVKIKESLDEIRTFVRGVIAESIIIESKDNFKKLKDNKVQLTSDERDIVKKKKATWSNNDSAIWKSKDKSGKVTFVTNTHRALNTATTLKGAISKFHNFIKGTA